MAEPNVKQRSAPAPVTEQIPEKIPDLEQPEAGEPDAKVATEEFPELTPDAEVPEFGHPENTVIIGGKPVEIKPMKLKYQRNRTAVFYHALELYTLPDILAMGPRQFGDNRTGDKALCDWLVAVTDDPDLIREHVDEMDTETVYKMLEIFRRVNKIDETEAKLKNRKTPEAEV